MKKFLSLLLVAVLVSAMFAIPVSADEYFWSEGEYELVADGNWSPYFSWGYVFEIDSVNSTSGSMTAIFDNATDYAAAGPGKWTTQLVLAPVEGEEGVYELVAAHKTTGKNAQANLDDGTIDFEDGKIVLSVQDAGTRPEKNDDGTLKFPNWEDRAAAWGLMNTIGAKLTLDGNTLTVEDDPNADDDAAPTDTVLLIDAINAASWGEDAVPFAPILVYGTENTVGGYIGGVWNGWWYKIIATYDEATDLFTVDEKLPNDGSTGYAEMTLEENQVMILVYCGAEAVVLEGVAVATNIEAGDTLKATGFDFTNEGGADLITKEGEEFVGSVYFTLVVAEDDDDDTVVSENIALGKPYSTNGQFRQGGKEVGWGWDENAPIAYPDEDGITMTDGKIAPEDGDYTAAEFAGWTTATPGHEGYNWINIDLGESYDLSKFVLWYGTQMLGNGIGAPDSVEIYVSEDGQNWGEAVGSATPANDAAVLNESVTIEADVTGRYVQFRTTRGGWVFLTEAEVYNAGSAAGDEEEPKEDIEAKMKELLGQAPADAKVDYVIEAPESYKAGDEITVTVTVKNITAENGIHVAAFKLLYDNEKLLLTNDLDEEDENALLCVKTLPKDWENLSSVANDYNADNEEGTVVNPLNDGVINVSVFTAKSSASAAIKEDGALVLEFTFKALDDAEGDIGLVIPHADAECAFNGKNGEEVYAANGSYAVIKAPVVEEESKPGDDPVEPGDASSMIIFAIIALIAIAGSAVVVKTRR